MKKWMMFLMACLLLISWQIAGYCEGEPEGALTDDSGIAQSESAVDQSLGSGIDSGIAQSESAVDQSLDSEVKSGEAEAEGEIVQMDASVDSGGMSN
jgi:hypothetical protein